jgi:hypothetical protein
MRKIAVSLSIGFPTATQKDEIEVEDDATAEEVSQAAEEWAWGYIDIGWSEKE